MELLLFFVEIGLESEMEFLFYTGQGRGPGNRTRLWPENLGSDHQWAGNALL